MVEKPKNTGKHGGKRAGAGRPSIYGERTVTISFACPTSLLDDLDALAESEGRSRSSILIEWVREGCNRRARRTA